MKVYLYWALFFSLLFLCGCTWAEQKESAETTEKFLPYITGSLTAFLGPLGTAIGALATGGVAVWKTAATAKAEKQQVEIVGAVEAGLRSLTPEQKEAVKGEISKRMDEKTKAKIRKIKALANI